jgi:hypothetical protein
LDWQVLFRKVTKEAIDTDDCNPLPEISTIQMNVPLRRNASCIAFPEIPSLLPL